jgi:curved DNA-binding protein CbpA
MIDKYYKILGVSKDDSNEVIDSRYLELKKKYNEERFLEGEAGNNAAKMLTEIENAYYEIKAYRNEQYTSSSGSFYQVESAIKEGNLQLAQQKLDEFDERSAEWHDYQSVIFYRKNWINESKKQLEIAISMNPSEDKYRKALEKIDAKINGSQNSTYNPDWNKSGNAYRRQDDDGERVEQLGGESCCQWCCEMAICNLALNMCCGCR